MRMTRGIQLPIERALSQAGVIVVFPARAVPAQWPSAGRRCAMGCIATTAARSDALLCRRLMIGAVVLLRSEGEARLALPDAHELLAWRSRLLAEHGLVEPEPA